MDQEMHTDEHWRLLEWLTIVFHAVSKQQHFGVWRNLDTQYIIVHLSSGLKEGPIDVYEDEDEYVYEYVCLRVFAFI